MTQANDRPLFPRSQRRRIRKTPVNWVHQLHRDDRGATYSLTVAMLLPVYIGFLAFTVEMILLLDSKQNLTTALQTGGHAVRAWTLHRDQLAVDGESLPSVVRDAMSRSMAPFATTRDLPTEADANYVRALQASGMNESASQRYGQKLQYVEGALQIQMERQQRETPGILIRVAYDSPLWIPFFEAVFSTKRRHDGPVRTLYAEQWVPMPEEELDRRSLGIPYSPKHSTAWPDEGQQ